MGKSDQPDRPNGPKRPEDPENGRSDRALWIRNLGLFSVIVTDLAACTGVGIGLGYLAWKKWGAPWWVLLLSSLAGLFVAFYRLYSASKRDWT